MKQGEPLEGVAPRSEWAKASGRGSVVTEQVWPEIQPQVWW